MIQSKSFNPRKILEILSSLFRFEHINIKFLYRHGPGLEIVSYPCVKLYGKYESNPLEVFLGKGILKIYSKFKGKHPCWSAISTKLQSNFIEITLRHGCSIVNLLHIFKTLFYKNTFAGLPFFRGCGIFGENSS